MAAHNVRLIAGTPRGRRLFFANALAAFGLISAAIQFLGQLYPPAIRYPEWLTLGTFVLCLFWGLLRARPHDNLRRDFKQPEITVRVEIGDLFAQKDANIVVGFSDTFDTSVTNNRVINEHSLQGQLLERRYGGSQRRLDEEIRTALRGRAPVATESRTQKRFGKLARYPIGTVAAIGPSGRRVFAVAYSYMSNDLIARSTVDDLWLSLSALWESVFANAQHGVVAMPLIGSGLARMDLLERQNLMRMLLLSFLARSRQTVVCRELRIVIWPGDRDKIDMLEAEAFLRTL
jgi:Domain of unknown function (DUF6430)